MLMCWNLQAECQRDAATSRLDSLQDDLADLRFQLEFKQADTASSASDAILEWLQSDMQLNFGALFKQVCASAYISFTLVASGLLS